MSALDQSLDAIISQNNKSSRKNTPARRTIKGSKRPQISSKSARGGRVALNNGRSIRPTGPASFRGRPITNQRRAIPTSNIPAKINPQAASLKNASKVVVSGLPKDIKQDSIRVCYY